MKISSSKLESGFEPFDDLPRFRKYVVEPIICLPFLFNVIYEEVRDLIRESSQKDDFFTKLIKGDYERKTQII
ncbi:MAG: hypothetical protein WC584_01875 [Candidatus Pacearchaeota archaeon]